MTRKLMKTLTLLRHAKTETGAATQDDIDRALVPRGIEAARTMGQYLVSHGISPDVVLCSTALRARQTASYLTSIQPRVEYSEKMYLPSAGEMLNMLAVMPEMAGHVMMIGHNPGMHELAVKLAKSGDEALLDALALNYPTCTLSTIRFDGEWRDIRHARGELAALVTPKQLG